jgi:hypothetical protein
MKLETKVRRLLDQPSNGMVVVYVEPGGEFPTVAQHYPNADPKVLRRVIESLRRTADNLESESMLGVDDRCLHLCDAHCPDPVGD